MTPRSTARQASLYLTNSWSSLKLTSIESVMPSSRLILGCPLVGIPKFLVCRSRVSYTYPHKQLEKAMAPHSSSLAWRIPWTEEPGRLQSMRSQSWTRLSDFTFTFHFHALEKEMATHSSVLALRSPGTGEPGGLPSMGSHRVRHD